MTYCIAPEDKNILSKITQQLPLSAAAQFVLRQSQVDSISIDSKSGQCRFVLIVPEELPESDLAQLTVFLREATCMAALEIEQRCSNDASSIWTQKEKLLVEYPHATPLARRALASADWKWIDSRLTITLRRALEID